MYVMYFITVWKNESICALEVKHFRDSEVLSWEVPTEAIAIL